MVMRATSGSRVERMRSRSSRSSCSSRAIRSAARRSRSMAASSRRSALRCIVSICRWRVYIMSLKCCSVFVRPTWPRSIGAATDDAADVALLAVAGAALALPLSRGRGVSPGSCCRGSGRSSDWGNSPGVVAPECERECVWRVSGRDSGRVLRGSGSPMGGKLTDPPTGGKLGGRLPEAFLGPMLQVRWGRVQTSFSLGGLLPRSVGRSNTRATVGVETSD